MTRLITVSLVFVLGCLSAGSTWAEQNKEGLPKWEVGLVAGLVTLPEYMGSDERYVLPLGAPYIIYRGDIVKADRSGIRGLLMERDNVSLDLGFSFGLPVENDNKAREGMPDLHLSGEVGPRLNWIMSARPGEPEFSFHLPLRYALDIKGNGMGWVAEPALRLSHEHLGFEGRGSLRADLGLLFASEQYNAYYYEVPDQYATATRPAYEATSGLHSLFAGVSGRYRMSRRMEGSAFLRVRSLEPGVVEDSPLVRGDLDVSAGIGFAWSLWQSMTTVGQ